MYIWISLQLINKSVKESIVSAFAIWAGNLFHVGIVEGKKKSMFVMINMWKKDGQLEIITSSGSAGVIVYTSTLKY